MAAFPLLAAVLATTGEQFLRWPYGPTGLAGLLLLGIGFKAGNTACSSAGAIVLALLVAAPSR
jgi:hypothetical protein